MPHQKKKEQNIIKIYIIDDHTLVRAALQSILADVDDMQLIGESALGEEGIAEVLALKPDVVLLDYKLSDINGLEVTQRLLSHTNPPKILILSGTENNLIPYYLLEAGARSFLTKDTPKEELLDAIRQTHRGERIISPLVAKQITLNHIDHKNDNPFKQLSSRQLSIMKQIILGKSNEEIAGMFNVEPKSIYNHRNRILKSLKLKNDVELTLLAWQHQLLLID